MPVQQRAATMAAFRNEPEDALKITREWATPLTIGSFSLIAVTGVLMFFHLDSGLNKPVHEWASWLLLAGVGLHVTANLPAFKRHFTLPRARWIVGAALAALALSFIPAGGERQPPFVVPMQALAAAPVPVLAQLAGIGTDEMLQRLRQAGTAPTGRADSVRSLVGPDLKRQMRVLGAVLAPAAG